MTSPSLGEHDPVWRHCSRENTIQCDVTVPLLPQDTSSRWENTIQLMEAIGHDDVRIYLKKRGNHRMLDDEDLHLQIKAVEELLENYPVGDGPAAASRL